MAEERWQELSRSECFALLAQRHLGRVVLVDDRGPAAFPVNFVLDNHTVVFRSDGGTKLNVARRGGQVAFEVDASDQAMGGGWSVLLRGEAIEVTDPDDLEHVRRLPLHPSAPGAKNRYVRILPSAVSGRRITPSAGAASDWWG